MSLKVKTLEVILTPKTRDNLAAVISLTSAPHHPHTAPRSWFPEPLAS